MIVYFDLLYIQYRIGVRWYTGTPKATGVSLGNRDQNLAVNCRLVEKHNNLYSISHAQLFGQEMKN